LSSILNLRAQKEELINMIINKGQTSGKIRYTIYDLVQCSVIYKSIKYPLMIIRESEIRALQLTHKDIYGLPERCALSNKIDRTILIYPKPDKRYKFEVIGSQYIVQ
jgi:hypothetical protein